MRALEGERRRKLFKPIPAEADRQGFHAAALRQDSVGSGQKQAIGLSFQGGRVTLVLGKLGGGAGRRSNGKCRVMPSLIWLARPHTQCRLPLDFLLLLFHHQHIVHRDKGLLAVIYDSDLVVVWY